jgi:polyhydroxyalkanoate synthesis repressor PhaR
MSEARIIKKYPNRRLYDTVESRYITLEDIRRLVLAQIDFVVLDKKTQEDITRSILLQVIAEQEHGGEPMMSEDFLSQVIRSYGGTMQSLVASYLEQSLKLFMTQQSQIRDRMRSVVGLDPMSAMTSMAQDNYARFRQMQDAFFQSLLTAGQPRQSRDEESKP